MLTAVPRLIAVPAPAFNSASSTGSKGNAIGSSFEAGKEEQRARYLPLAFNNAVFSVVRDAFPLLG